MKKQLRFLYITLLGVIITSCTENLELQPTSVISNASFWKTQDDATGGIYGMYVNLRAQASKNLFLWGEARSETVGAGVQGLDGRDLFYLNQLDATNSGPDWQGMYTVIHHANLIIKYVPGISFTSEATKNNILAQAYAMRAYVYFCMVRTWGELPLVTEPTENFDPTSIQRERSSVANVFTLIKSDLDKSLALFSNNTFPTGRNVWSKPALNALKGDVYLWTAKKVAGGKADYNTALEALNQVKSSDVALMSNYNDIFDYTTKGNKEIIFAINFKRNEVTDNDYANMYFSPAYVPKDINTEVAAALGVAAGQNFWAPAAAFRSQFTDDDQRKSGTFREIYTASSGVSKFYGAFAVKFNGIVDLGVRYFLDDYIVYRYADILLMIAEVKNALGQDPSSEIMQVRTRAYGSKVGAYAFTNGSQAQNDDVILQERLLELGLEGKRWWDLVRFNKVFDKVASLKDRTGKDYLLLFPISANTLSLENKIKQNPGY
ncbi:RagB/SusD family nutrient uptake outer membrane protein [Siphonobacter sp. SORGH_AS_0500]|uniref:RagB/SusD family nutrient uptake outer membrane protein n=1 Tax=Siphonobacter sp. SORGH_AS_0500 TaxID=1864824 RepID=UPI000CBED73A|nr:RagB/SusD family nutrient uptake outer membrane protein [Siphonobacter sp. SORGH_AS_0500]PKK37435.1 RagB/SusD family nutrient uptake outer membrane protein [Siphonobacter sp. SORGH_AS_0500]